MQYSSYSSWIRTRIDTLGAIFTACLAAYLVYGGSTPKSASDTGFSLNMAVGFAYTLLWWVGNLNALEVQGNCGLIYHILIDTYLFVGNRWSQLKESINLESNCARSA